MIGIIVVTHGNIGLEMVQAAKRIIPDALHLAAVSVTPDLSPSSIRKQVEKAIHQVPHEDGTLILTDMFGGTPSNACTSLLSENKVEMISGVNLPMLIKLASMKTDFPPFEKVAHFLKQYGRRNIVVASDVLEGDISSYE
ncbi:MAG: hypothetical protein A3I05_07605 [Deltaproteobacteria bacterium RIFCSPLOWO2_02_FULL_44_10]|nr:MAG: hypothetical protein A3C46_04395 [Deltaproteobacteria bacterium RIFCSPHIGHO2_02_FULL_44_16]OGQ47038.1 MAG: hypothetical protein A3I05_07605 [Deltaproteobacteria bacterium RIFCSPLOWO2_02_FULL_44_10]